MPRLPLDGLLETIAQRRANRRTALAGGLAGALAFTRLIESQLWNVTPTDPLTYAAVSVLLVAIAALACVIPARRALSVNPTTALRND